MPTITTGDGVELHYQLDDFRDPWISDQGDTILMSHGLSRSMKWWTQWVPGLSRKYRVLRYDIRGCGESSAPPERAEWSAERLATDVLDLIDHLGIPDIHWVGSSSGGLWGMVFATTYPDRIKSLTLINTPGSWGGEGGKTSKAISEVGHEQWLKDTNATRLDMSMADPRMVEWHTVEHSKAPTHVTVSIMQVVESMDIPRMLPDIRVPTLLMVGDRHPSRTLDTQYAMQKQIPNASMVVFPNMGSGFNLLIPDRCVQELMSFLESVVA